jgi:hypothetical protein
LIKSAAYNIGLGVGEGVGVGVLLLLPLKLHSLQAKNNIPISASVESDFIDSSFRSRGFQLPRLMLNPLPPPDCEGKNHFPFVISHLSFIHKLLSLARGGRNATNNGK